MPRDPPHIPVSTPGDHPPCSPLPVIRPTSAFMSRIGTRAPSETRLSGDKPVITREPGAESDADEETEVTTEATAPAVEEQAGLTRARGTLKDTGRRKVCHVVAVTSVTSPFPPQHTPVRGTDLESMYLVILKLCLIPQHRSLVADGC